MKLKNTILLIEFILILILGSVSIFLICDEFKRSADTASMAETETHTYTEEIAQIELPSVTAEPETESLSQQILADGTILPDAPVNIEPIETTQHIEEETEEIKKPEDKSSGDKNNSDEKVDVRIRDEEDKLNIVVFGDSIWDDKRYEDSVANLLAGYMNANVYNCAMGGTNAALVGESSEVKHWDSRSLNGMVYVATDKVDAEIQLAGYPALQVSNSINYDEVDYFIFSYGLNDYFCGTDIMPEDLLDLHTYVGALRHATQVMKQKFPNADFLIMSPTYCQFLNLDGSIVDCYEKDFGGGNLEAYVEGAYTVAGEYSTLYLDAFNTFGINKDTAPIYLYDGIHLSAEGRMLYARKVADFLLSAEKNRLEDEE